MDITSWLEQRDLGSYAGLLAQHQIDLEALPHLTNAMLEQIGLPLGPRAKLLAAAARLRPGRDFRAVPGERRQITVMFCDLVDSTRLAARLDPEDFARLILAYQKRCEAAVARYEGHISQYLGDGVEVLFGWPFGQEDAAERSVRAGLEIAASIQSLNGAEPLSVRVGITTGIVAVGIDEFWAPLGPVGEALHVAARLQNLALANSVLIAEPTKRLIAAHFDLEDLGPQQLKGLPHPVGVFRVLRPKPHSSRFHAGAKTLTPLVGRSTELALLQQRWKEAKEGEGRVVFLSGVAGIGKSRIAFELEKLVQNDPHISIGLQCLPHRIQSALFPIVQYIERLGRVGSEETSPLRIARLEKLVALGKGDRESITPLLASVISLPTADRYAPIETPAQTLKTQTLTALVELVCGSARRRPVLCVVEDAQWIDPSTQELLELLAGRAAAERLLLIVTHRPEYRTSAGLQSHASSIAISRLGRREATEMARLVLPAPTVSGGMVEKVVEDSDAVPLFIEELARGASDASPIHSFEPTADRPEHRPPGWVPDSLRDSLVARLDQAPKARRVAQTAAVIGREFAYDSLLRVSGLEARELQASLSHLAESDIINVVATKPSPRYAFKHALLRDAAYDSLLRSSRRELHAKVAVAIEAESPDIGLTQPELLAYHYTAAGNAELASQYWLAGGRRARQRWANVEAIMQFENALTSLSGLPDSSERNLTELEIHLYLGFCCIAAHGYSADVTRRSFERACELGAKTGEAQHEIQAVYGLWGHFWMRAEHSRAREIAGALLEKANRVSDPFLLVLAHRALGSTLLTAGEFVRAREHLERAVSLGSERALPGLPPSFAVAPSIAAQLMLALDLWILGYPDQALDRVSRAPGVASGADPYTAAFAHYMTSAIHLLRGDYASSLRHADLSLTISVENRINLYALYSRFGRGCALLMLGQKRRGRADIQSGIEDAKQSQLGYMRGFMRGWLAIAQAETGDAELALATIDGALAEVNEVSGFAWEAELHRLRGEILLQTKENAQVEAEQCFRKALATAKKQHARSLELRATISLARLLGIRPQSEPSLAMLSEAIAMEGGGTLDGREARRLVSLFER